MIKPHHLVYPPAPRDDTVEVLHGVTVKDPFRPLEDFTSPEAKAWVDAENALSEDYLAKLPGREWVREKLTEIMSYARMSAPWREGGKYFFFKNSGLENQDRLFFRSQITGPEKEILNPNGLSQNGTSSLLSVAASPNGKYLAYQLSQAGSDWAEIRVRDIDKGQDLPDLAAWVKFSQLSWKHDSSGFYYSRYDAPPDRGTLSAVNRFQKLYFHRLGCPEDELIYETPEDGDIGTQATQTSDGRYLILKSWKGTRPQHSVHCLEDASAGPRSLVPPFAAAYHFIGSRGAQLLFRTTMAAARGRVVAIDADLGFESLNEVVPEQADTLEFAVLRAGHIVACYLKDGAHSLRIFNEAGEGLHKIELPGIGCVQAPQNLDETNHEFYFTFESLTLPPTVFCLHVQSGQLSCVHRPNVKFDPDAYETRRDFCVSKDGTRIPIFLAHKRNLSRDGQAPALLYGYGGFGLPVLPWFRTSRMAWLEAGGIYASACLRGGGEYGEAWHQAGTLTRKQNVFDDFISAAQWLTREKYTNPSRLAINGGSNGGLLVAASMLQRPEIFGAVVAAVGVFDMLRFHKFTIGWAWTSDYGNPDIAEDFHVLKSYSPLHNIDPERRYPSILICTGDHDDRVVPAHSYKFAAALQAAHEDGLTLLRVETDTGHGQGKPVKKLLAETADIYAFLFAVLNVRPAG